MLNNMHSEKKPGLLAEFSQKYNLEPAKLLETLKKIVFKQRDGQEVTNEQMISMLVVANQYNLNPFTKEIFAFPDKNNGIIPVISVDGWVKIINSHFTFYGMEFNYSQELVKIDDRAKECPSWIECILYLKDKAHPVVVREYLDEVYKPAFKGKSKDGSGFYFIDGPWQSHTKRMLRHKALIQAARYAFGFSGVYDKEEAEDIVKNQTATYDIQHTSGEKLEFKNQTEYLKKILDERELTAENTQKVSHETIEQIENNIPFPPL